MTTPVANRFVLAAKAASRGTLNKFLQSNNGTSKRFLTLPPGSVRGYPFRGQSIFEGYLSDHEDDCVYEKKIEVKGRMKMNMSPKRRYATTFDMPEYVGHFPSQVSFEEDYDEWSIHSSPTNATSCDLGQLYDGEAVDATLFATTLLGNSVQVGEHSSFFESSEADDYYAELKTNYASVDDKFDVMVDDGDDC